MIMRPKTGWTSVVLIALMLLTVAWSIGLSQPAPGIEILTPIVICGVIAGTIFAGLYWLPAGIAHGWSIVIGLIATIYFAAGAITGFPSAPAAALAELGRYERMGLVRDWYFAWTDYQSSSAGSCVPAGAYFPSECSDLAYLFFDVTMGLLMWLLAYICTWFVIRYVSWWGAVLPSCFALVFNLTNSKMSDAFVLYLGFFLLCSLLLASLTFKVAQTEKWQSRNIGYSQDIGFDLVRDGVVLSLVVVAFAWSMPDEINSSKFRRWANQAAKNPRARDHAANASMVSQPQLSGSRRRQCIWQGNGPRRLHRAGPRNGL